MTDGETADRLVRRRARMMLALGVMILLQQVSYFSGRRLGEQDRLVDHLAIGGWLAMSIVLLAGLVTGGFWRRSSTVRALVNDEGSRANRAAAFQVGFIVTMTGAILLYILSLFEPVGGRDAIHVLVTIGLASALMRYGLLEHRALKGA